MKISVIGQGFVGLSLSVVLASKNFPVFAIEKNQKKLEMLKEGKIPFYEPEINLFLSKAIKKKKISFHKVISDIEDEGWVHKLLLVRLLLMKLIPQHQTQ